MYRSGRTIISRDRALFGCTQFELGNLGSERHSRKRRFSWFSYHFTALPWQLSRRSAKWEISVEVISYPKRLIFGWGGGIYVGWTSVL